MHKLVQGVKKFQHEVFGSHSELFAKLKDSQRPHTLFITCSDSRISPNLLTQTNPGEIFILRNAGNLVPAYGTHFGAEAAAIEYAISVLDVDQIVVCGHSSCGAMRALLHPDSTQDLPAMRAWLAHAESARRIARENYRELGDEALLNVTVQENVLAQLDNLRTHPTVAAALARGRLHMYGWVYKIPTGEVFAFDPAEGQFRPLRDTGMPAPRPRVLESSDEPGF